jgi:LmbE family N-acetylglucosaminyl deacetylase
MHQLNLTGTQAPATVLLLGAHCDDIEIGCGASILRLKQDYPDLHWCWVVFSSSEAREVEARRSANAFLQGVKHKRIIINRFRNGYFPYIGETIKDYFESLKEEINPNIIFTHYRDDLHQDHRIISQLTINTFRDHLILEYEIMKYDGDLGHTNFFMPASIEKMTRKIDYLFEFYITQLDKQWFSRETFQSLMRLRGIECNSTTGYAEAFYCRKLTV